MARSRKVISSGRKLSKAKLATKATNVYLPTERSKLYGQ